MYLSRLELHGFKSFASRTILDFDPGVTAVVGPNGCGKSNIVDAVRWVIGEQRARILRSDKMENVIFNGTLKKRPLGMAEVLLTIENTRGVLPVEYSEITIGRRLYRSGESDYLLNGTLCRLKDITDLFMDTGMGAGAYSVIELKMIEEILSDNAQDRRRLFEEAAGITKYKIRRGQTLRKLDGTRSDLQRLRDLVEEIDKRVRSLKRQANRAERYREIEQRLRGLELSLAALEFQRLSGLRGELEKQLQGLQDVLEGDSAQHGQSEAELEAVRMELIACEEAFSEAQSALSVHLETARSLDSERALKSERVDGARRDVERAVRERDEAAERLSTLASRLEGLTGNRTAADAVLQRAADALKTATVERDDALAAAGAAREALAEARADEQALLDASAERIRTVDRLTARLEMLASGRQLASTSLTELGPATHAAESNATACAEEATAARGLSDEAVSKLDAAASARGDLERQLDGVRRDMREAVRSFESASAEVKLLESLVSSYEDFSEAVQFLADEADWSSRPLRTVADVIQCAPEHRAVVDSALSGSAAWVVAANEAEARKAVAKLRRADRGRATFVVLDRLKGVPAASEKGIGRSLASLVETTEPSCRPLVDLLLRDAVLVDNLDDIKDPVSLAPGIRAYNARGEWLDAHGVYRAGGDAPEDPTLGGRLKRRERLDEARQEFEVAGRHVRSLEERVDSITATMAGLDLEALRALASERRDASVDCNSRLQEATFQLQTLRRKEADLNEEFARLAEEQATAERELARLSDGVRDEKAAIATVQGRRVELEEAFHVAESNSRAELSRYNESRVAEVEARGALDQLTLEIEHNRGATAELTERRQILSSRIESLGTQIEEGAREVDYLRERIEELSHQRPGLEKSVSERKDELNAVRVRISDLEASLRDLRRSRDERMRQENERAVRRAEVHTRLEDLVRHVHEDYGVDLEHETVPIEEGVEEEPAREEVRELRERVRSMGPINALALQEYEDEKQRLEFMSGQLEDLESAERTLVQTINEINETASRRFMESFDAIRINFLKLFEDLFGTDTFADVLLQDPADPLESAIEIMAKPRGKKPSSIAQLSGGEKTLTAIALLFAIYLVKPSPFCILDEVDAPLDDANVDRFMQLIRDFSDTTQFILVTHNKRTMEAADRMYGVTMQQQGVSSLVGVTFGDSGEPTQPEATGAAPGADREPTPPGASTPADPDLPQGDGAVGGATPEVSADRTTPSKAAG